MKRRKQMLAELLVLVMLLAFVPNLAVPVSGIDISDTYTFDMPAAQLPTNWSPMAWVTHEDQMIMQYTMTPLVDVSVKDSDRGESQWIYLAAESVTDVTDQLYAEETEGLVYEITLNPELCWEDGTPINADTYIYSMQQILDPEMNYPQADMFCEGNLGILGAEGYRHSGKTEVIHNYQNDKMNAIRSEMDLVLGEDGNYYDSEGRAVYIILTTPLDYLGDSLSFFVKEYGEQFFDKAAYEQLAAQSDQNGNVVLNPETLTLIQQVISSKPAWGEDPSYFVYYIGSVDTWPVKAWSTVGLYKLDEYTIQFWCNSRIKYGDFLMALKGVNWLVNEKLYEQCKSEGTYGRSVNTSISYGPYRVQGVENDKVVLTRNESHYEYTLGKNERITSQTDFLVDGFHQPQWEMDSIVFHVTPDDMMEQRFLSGELDYWKPDGTAATDYLTSRAMYTAPTTSTFCMNINANVEVLKAMDENYGTSNAVVLSNVNFRKAFSYMMDRSVWGSTRVPDSGLFSTALCYEEDDGSFVSYRRSDAAMQALCEHYNMEYGPGKEYATLEDAYQAIVYYDPELASDLMVQACEELVGDGLYRKGEPIVLTFIVSSLSEFMLNSAENLTMTLNTVAQDSGFGTITIQLRNTPAWSDNIRKGIGAMVLSGWVHNALDAFGAMDVYCNPNLSYVPLNLDLKKEMLTLNISGREYTMSWYDWSGAIRNGRDDFADINLRLEALAKLECAYLDLYYVIPYCTDISCQMLSYQLEYYTDIYHSLYEFGGLRLAKFRYSDSKWEEMIASGNLDYTTNTCSHNYLDGICAKCGAEDPDYIAEIANGWSGATQWILTDDGVLTVYGTGNMKNYDYAGGQPWLNKGVEIVSVVIEEGVTGIGSGAFKDLTTLKSVTLPETLTKIGEAAFYGSGLESVEIPASLWTIQPYTFKNCTNLTSVTFHEGNLEKISDGAFYGTGLTEVVLPDCLDILDVYAFKGCAYLTSITIGSGLTELREAVFYGTAIPTIEIPEGITKIGPYAFKNCVALETIDLPESLTSVGEASFYADTALKTVELPDGVTEIGNYAFRKCESIEALTLSEELVTVGECAFYGCTGLTELVIPDKVITIKPYAFKTCTGLTSVTLGNSVETIGEGAFNTCTGLKTIVFPASLKVIGDYAFANSEKLWKLTFLGNAPSIGTGAFKGLDAEAWYPGENTTWTAENMQNYGGKITWKSN